MSRKIYCGDGDMYAIEVRSRGGRYSLWGLSGVSKGSGRGQYKERLLGRRSVLGGGGVIECDEEMSGSMLKRYLRESDREREYDAVESVDSTSGRTKIRLLYGGIWEEVVLIEHRKSAGELVIPEWEELPGDPLILRLRYRHEDTVESFESMLGRGVGSNVTVLIDLLMTGSSAGWSEARLLDLIKGFVGVGADVNAIDERGRTALMLCAAGGYIDVACYLLDLGASLLSSDVSGRSALRYACSSLELGMLELLLSRGAVVESACLSDVFDRSDDVIGIAEMGMQRRLLCCLLGTGVELDINVLGDRGLTCLMHVARYHEVGAVSSSYIESQLSLLGYLLEMGCSVSTLDKSGRTVLMHALERGNVRVSGYLLERGCSVILRDHSGRNASWYAERHCEKLLPKLHRMERSLGIDVLRTQALQRGLLRTLPDLERRINLVYRLHAGGTSPRRIARTLNRPLSEIESYLSNTF